MSARSKIVDLCVIVLVWQKVYVERGKWTSHSEYQILLVMKTETAMGCERVGRKCYEICKYMI